MTSSLSDELEVVRGLAVRAGAASAALNVLINLPGLSDASYVKTTRKEASDLCNHVTERSDAIYQHVLDHLEKSFEA